MTYAPLRVSLELVRKNIPTIHYIFFGVFIFVIAALVVQTQQPQEIRQHAQAPSDLATQLYVAPNGSGDCSQASPCSLTTADSKATAGTTIIAADGMYNGNIAITKGGSAGNFVTYKSQNKHGATIVGGGENSAVTIKAPFVRFQDFTVTGEKTRNGFEVGASDVEIIGNHIHHITQWKTGNTNWKGGAGIDTAGGNLSNLLFDSNTIDHVGAPGSTESLVHGMYLSTHVTNGRVTNNVITDIEDFGLHPYDETEASGWEFINNTIANTGRGILQAPNGVTRNNIVFNTRGAAYDIRGSGNVVENNLAGGTGSGGSANGVTTGDPMFVSATDFHLKPGSPAIDKGKADGAPKADFEGKPRPQGAGIDLGAFESGDAAVSPGGAPATSGTPSTGGVAYPTFGVIQPCPSCASPSVAQASGGVTYTPGTNGTVSTAPVGDPCTANDSSYEDNKHKKKHKQHKGGISNIVEKILKFLIELLEKLIELLGGGKISAPEITAPEQTPEEPEVVPSTASPCPQVSQEESQPVPSSGQEAEPSVAVVSPVAQNMGMPQPPAIGGTWNLAFSDEFNGTAVDAAKWSFTSSAESTCDAEGCSNPGNQQLEYNWGKNCSVAGGILTITAKREQHGSSAWTSCMLHSKPQFQTMYLETRAKLPAKKGFWPGFWTWNSPSDEVDIFEYYSDNKTKIYLTDHTGGGGGCTPTLAFDPTADFHTYAANMDGSKITWYIDGKQACSAAGSPHQAASILLDMFVYSQIPPDASTTSDTMQVDFIRAWQKQ